jgi:hypothetical protein
MVKNLSILLPDFDELPSCISIPLKKTLEESNNVRRLHLLIHTYKQIVHFLAICFVCEYVYSGIHDSEIEQLIVGLKKPLLGYWIKILQNLPSYLSRHKDLFIKEWKATFSKLERKQYDNCFGFDLATHGISLPGIEAFLRLRNSLSHGALPPDEILSERLFNHYLPILVDIIESIHFLKGFSLSYSHKLSDTKLPEGLIGEVFLNRLSDGSQLKLSPLIVTASSINTIQSLSNKENFLIYEGISRDAVYYLGIEGKYEVNENIEIINNILFSRGNINKGYWKESFFEQIKRTTLDSISSNRSKNYLHNVYQSRVKYDSIIKDFIYEENNKNSCLLLISEGGVGKTSLLCNFFSAHLLSDYINPLPLLISANSFSVADKLNTIYCNGELGQLGNFLKNLLNLSEVNLGWLTLIQAIEDRIEAGFTDLRPKLIICLDGINEAPNPYHLLQEFDYVVRLARNIPWLSCIGTIRKGSFELLLAKLNEWGIQWPHSERSYVRDSSTLSGLKVGVYLEPFSYQEACLAYQKYQKQSVSNLNSPASLSSYQDLPEAIRQMIRQPLTLDFLMNTYNQKLIPATLAPVDLFDEFHSLFINSLQLKIITKIAARCLKLKQSDFSLADVQDIIDDWFFGKDEFELMVLLNPLEQLVDLGIFVYKNKARYKFTHQLYFEFVIFKLFQEQSLSINDFTDKVVRVLKYTDQHLDEEIGATKLLFISQTRNEPEKYISILISLAEFDLFIQFFTPILYEFYRINKNVYERISKAVLKQNNKVVLLKFYEIYKTICDRENQNYILSHLLAIDDDKLERATIELKYIRLLTVLNRISEAVIQLHSLKNYAEENDQSELLLDIYAEEGYLYFLQGNSIDSLSAYDKAEILIKKIKPNLEEDDYLQRQRNIYAGKGCSQHNIDDNEACLKSHSSSLLIDKKLDNKSAIALDLVNIADAQWGCYQYGEALKTYEKAIDISKKTCYQDALNVALIGRGMVLWSIGLFEEANISINSGLEISSQMLYTWDLAYGLIYKSNVQATIKSPQAIQTNKKALALAKEFGAEYLIELSNIYLFWKYENRQPGLISNLKRIQESLERCQFLKMYGLEIMLLTMKALNRAANLNFPDSSVMEDISFLLSTFVAKPLIKGPWERMGLHLIHVSKTKRQMLDLIDLVDTVDDVCEQKANSLSNEDRIIYTANLERCVFL